MDLIFITCSALCVPIAAVWWWRRRRIARGDLCWNCGANLRDRSLYFDFKDRSRCPKYGNELDVTDVYELP
jgi:hypothetical protein